MEITHNGAQTRIARNWQNIERSVQRLEMILRLNHFTVWRFSPNTASHSKINCCWWNKHLPQIIKSVVLCEETSDVTDVSKHRSCFADRSIYSRFFQPIANCWQWSCFYRRIEHLITFPPYFCNIISSKDEFNNKVFPNIIAN